jgi:uncharacterized protein (TIGR03086 family)
MDSQTFGTALATFEGRLAGVPAGGWHASTPCADWTVRELVNHVTAELLWMPPLFEGKTIAEVGDRFDGDVLGDDPAATFEEAAAAASEVAGHPGAREKIVHLSFGDVPGAEYLGQLATDLTIHAWDLARGAGQDDHLDGDLVAAVHEFLAPQAELWRGAGAFGPAVEVGDDADAQTRLLALAGRRRV